MGNLGIQLRMLGHVADLRAGGFGRQSEHADCPALRLNQPEDELDQGGLAAAVGTNHPDEVAVADRQVDIAEDLGGVVREAQVLDSDDGFDVDGIFAGISFGGPAQ